MKFVKGIFFVKHFFLNYTRYKVVALLSNVPTVHL